MEEGRLHREVLIPMAKWQSRDDTLNGFNSPDRSSPPLYEVELTASDEDDDTSVLELVIPLQSKYKRVPKSTPKQLVECITLFCTTFCCIR